MAKRLAEVKVETFVTLLSKIKAEALIDTLANRLTDVEQEILAETRKKVETLGDTLAVKRERDFSTL